MLCYENFVQEQSMTPSRTEILRLYKELLRYSKFISLTDKNYYIKKIQKEFRENKNSTENIDFLYQAKRQNIALKEKHRLIKFGSFHKTMLVGFGKGALGVTQKLNLFFIPQQIISRGKKLIDKSLVPKLDEKDLEEHFIKGSGPGGSNVNKTVNCVYLLHKPTRLSVKVHDSRELNSNRKLARKKLITLLDNLINGENSIENQIKNIECEKAKKKLQKQRALMEKKMRWKATLQ